MTASGINSRALPCCESSKAPSAELAARSYVTSSSGEADDQRAEAAADGDVVPRGAGPVGGAAHRLALVAAQPAPHAQPLPLLAPAAAAR